MTTAQSIIEKLAAGAVNMDLGTVPDAALVVARRCLVDVVGVMLAGSATASAGRIRTLASEAYGAGPCSVAGSTDGLTAPGAALANGAAAHALDFDDNSYAGVVHGSAVVLPAVLAVAQETGASGESMLTGFIAGLEVEFAVGRALTTSFYEHGWWTTSALGGMGAAAGVARVLGLDAETTTRAIALAAAGAGGLRAVRGTDAKHYHCGRAAEAGVMAAKLAALGATAPAGAFEDSSGFLKVMNDAILDARPIETIGREYSLEDPGVDIKRFPICYAGHAAAEAAEEIIGANALSAGDVQRVVCTVPPLVASNLTYTHPTKPIEAQFSLEFAVAAIILHGDIGLHHLEPEIIADPAMRAMLDKIEMRLADQPNTPVGVGETGPEWGEVSLTTVAGDTFEALVGWPTGSAPRPIADAALEAKFMACAARAEQAYDARSLLDSLQRIEDRADCRSIL